MSLLHSGAPSGLWGSFGYPFGVVEFIRGRWVHSVAAWRSLGSFGFALGDVGFIRCRWVHSGVSCGSLDSSGVIGFTRVRPRSRSVHSRSLGYLGLDMGSSGVVVVTQVHPGYR